MIGIKYLLSLTMTNLRRKSIEHTMCFALSTYFS